MIINDLDFGSISKDDLVICTSAHNNLMILLTVILKTFKGSFFGTSYCTSFNRIFNK